MYTKEDIIFYLQYLTLNQTIFNQFQKSIEELSASYVFQDDANNPQITKQLIDFASQLKVIGQKYQHSQAIPATQYFRELVGLFRQLGDAHFYLRKPAFYSNFEQVLPLALNLTNDGWVFISSMISEQQNTAYTSRFGDLSRLRNRRILRINNLDPLTYIQSFADEHSSHRFQNQRFAQAVLSDFHYIGLERFADLAETEIDIAFEGENVRIYRGVWVAFPEETSIDEAKLQQIFDTGLRTSPFAMYDVQSQIHTKQQILKDIDKIHTFQVLKDSNDETKQQTIDSSVQGLTHLASVIGFFALYRYEPTQDFILHLLTYEVREPYADSMMSLLDALRIVKNSHENQRLFIININGGGNPDLSSLLALALIPSIFPIFPKSQFRHSKLSDLLNRVTSSINQMHTFDEITGNEMHYFIMRNDTIDNTKWAIPSYYNKSDYFSFDFEDSQNGTTVIQQFQSLNGIGKDPNQVIIVTNGLCASAAGYFSNFLKYNNFGVFITFGTDYEQICYVPGGLFISDFVFESAIHNVLGNDYKYQKYNQSEIDYLKQTWLPAGEMGITLYSTFSTNHRELNSQRNYPIDFRTDLRNDIIINRFLTKNEIQRQNIIGVIINTIINNSTLFNTSNYFGKLCNDSQNQQWRIKQGKCLPFQCKNGYRYETNNTESFCVLRYDRFNDLNNLVATFAVFWQILISLCSVGGFVIFLLTIFYIYRCKLKKQKSLSQSTLLENNSSILTSNQIHKNQ